MKAVVVSLIGVLGATTAYTSIRAIGKRAHPMHAMVSFSIVSVTLSSVGMVVTKTEFFIPTRLDWLALLAMIGIFGFLAQILLTMGLQRETAGRGTLAVYSKIIFATILERILFHTFPSYLSVIGTLMIVVSALYIALTKEKTKQSTSQLIHLPMSDDEALEQGLASSSHRA
jgi:drug/metabolite transporter (DMT)-like permease